MPHKVPAQAEIDAIIRGDNMEQHDEYTGRLEKNLSSTSKELLKQIVRNNRLKEQITFLIDKLTDIDFVIHGEGARNINWWEISKAAATKAINSHLYSWGDKVEIFAGTQWVDAIFLTIEEDGGYRTILRNGTVFVVPEKEIRPLKEE